MEIVVGARISVEIRVASVPQICGVLRRKIVMVVVAHGAHPQRRVRL